MTATLEAVHPVLMSRDVSSSIGFFAGLGFALLFQDDAENPRYAVIRRDAVELHLQWADDRQFMPGLDRPVYRFWVPDVDGLHHEFEQAGCLTSASQGGSPWASPRDTPWGTREFHVRDPDGNGLQFYRVR